MSGRIKFIHCSDIHLGANPYGVDERFEDMGKAFMQVVDLAIIEKVDFVIIAGDFFHVKNLNAKTLEQAVDLLTPLKENSIPVYMTEGNHDMATYTNTYSWLDFLSKKEYIHLLKPTELEDGNVGLATFDHNTKVGSIIERADCYIVGLGYPGATASTLISRLSEQIPVSPEKPVVTMLHAGIDKFVTEGMGGLREEEIEQVIAKSDYIALGHIHTRYDNLDNKYFNPGSIEKVKIESLAKSKTENDKGFYLVELDKGKRLTVEFKKVSIRNSYNIEVDLSGLDNNTESIKEKILSVLSEKIIDTTNDEGIILSIKLVGVLADHSTIVDVFSLRKEIKTSINVIYLELLNMLSASASDKVIFDKSKSREDIDKEVLKRLIKDEGFGDDDVAHLLGIAMQMKEMATGNVLSIEKQEGSDIKGLIEKFIEERLM